MEIYWCLRTQSFANAKVGSFAIEHAQELPLIFEHVIERAEGSPQMALQFMNHLRVVFELEGHMSRTY